MIFKLLSSHFYDIKKDSPELFGLLEPYCDFRDNNLYIDINDISILQSVINAVKGHEEIYNDYSWVPTEVAIDFKNKCVTLIDGIW